MAEELNILKNNLQCRSHHQKMLKSFGSIDKIIKRFTTRPHNVNNVKEEKYLFKGSENTNKDWSEFVTPVNKLVIS